MTFLAIEVILYYLESLKIWALQSNQLKIGYYISLKIAVKLILMLWIYILVRLTKNLPLNIVSKSGKC